MKKVKNNKNYGYHFNVYQIETTEGPQWCVEYPDVRAVVGGGDTPEEAIAEAKDNLNAYIEYLLEEGLELPIASKYESEYSGKVTLRMSYNLHRKVSELSELEGVSINSYINEALMEKTQNDINSRSVVQIISESASKIKNRIINSLLFSDNYEINNYSSDLSDDQKFYINKQRSQYIA